MKQTERDKLRVFVYLKQLASNPNCPYGLYVTGNLYLFSSPEKVQEGLLRYPRRWTLKF